MTGLEIILIVIGIAAVSISFMIGEKIDGGNANSVIDMDEVKETVKEQVDEAVVNIIDDTVEKTAQELDKISNEKIMAVNDYSENVLGEINKNHEEVMFLYSMLNDKEEEIKNTVRDVENVKRSVNKLAEENEKTFQRIEKSIEENQAVLEKAGLEMDKIAMKETEARMDGELAKANAIEENKEMELVEEVPVSTADKKSEVNNNQRILELYKDGFTNIEIAKMLNLGMGEVRLVIDLYKNRTR